MFEWDRLFAVVPSSSRSVDPRYPKSTDRLRERSRTSWRTTSEQVSTFVFFSSHIPSGMSRGKVKWKTRVVDSVIPLEFAGSLDPLFTTCSRNLLRGRFAFCERSPFEGARLFTGETTRVSWTPVKLAYKLELRLNASIVGDDVQVPYCRELKYLRWSYINLIKAKLLVR